MVHNRLRAGPEKCIGFAIAHRFTGLSAEQWNAVELVPNPECAENAFRAGEGSRSRRADGDAFTGKIVGAANTAIGKSDGVRDTENRQSAYRERC